MDKKILLMILLFFQYLQSNCQHTFISQSNGIYFKISLNDVKSKRGKSANFRMRLEVINYDTVAKYIPVTETGSTEKIKLIFSEFSKPAHLISFFIGTCNEEMFPYHCDTDSFLLKRLSPKEKVICDYTFLSSHPISFYLAQFKTDFIFRFMNSPRAKSKEESLIFYNEFLRRSQKIVVSYNSNEYSTFLKKSLNASE
jgi:hypothetical protein